ncbi:MULTISPECIES: CBS domain-containing protein [Acidianus]|uniref:Histidine kinase n=1 Tax=Candidatus Acidianus copahuensis TaxID=1160895 RepID=A0A031LP19_9CREN|nr:MULTISPECIES: CBS domain-containing protein [Acidianus]EZQ04914.1 histidine kinase [Candidatus Acidianus copahuensis]NON61188.1 CBS domain-containing protein [Acidianus sp. RZ1]
MSLKQFISKTPITCEPSNSIKEAASIMRKNNVSSLVLFNGKYPVGIVTERDITRAVADGIDLNKPVESIASKNVISIDSSKNVLDAAVLMKTHGIRHLLVLDGEKLIGVLSQRDISDALSVMMMEELTY